LQPITVKLPRHVLGLVLCKCVATVTAMSSTTLCVIPKDEILRLPRSDRHFSEYFINFLLARNILIAQRVVDLLFDNTEKRLIRALLSVAVWGQERE